MKIEGLTKDDVDMLLEALDAYKSKDLASELMGDIVESLVLPKKRDANGNVIVDEREQVGGYREEAERKRQLRAEAKKGFVRQVDILKAKVLLNSKPDFGEEIA